jgi:hypothetical protein
VIEARVGCFNPGKKIFLRRKACQYWERGRPRPQARTARTNLKEFVACKRFALRAHCGRGRPRSQYSRPEKAGPSTVAFSEFRKCHAAPPKRRVKSHRSTEILLSANAPLSKSAAIIFKEP